MIDFVVNMVVLGAVITGLAAFFKWGDKQTPAKIAIRINERRR